MLKDSHKKSLWLVFDKSNQTICELEEMLRNSPSPWRMVISAGVGTLLGNLYMSVERILRLFIENVYGEKLLKDEAWHKMLIGKGYERCLLPCGIETTLDEMRKFRHFLAHGYGIDMDEAELRENVPEAIRSYREIEAHIIHRFPELRK
jgi:uncharacterized protein YutE (UPF0331/DUF86 family)